GEVVGDRPADAHGREVGVAGELEETAVADAHPVEARTRRVRAVLPERADAHEDELRVEVAGTDVPLLERARPEVLDHDVSRRRKPAEEVLTPLLPQIDRHALAAAALDGPEQRVAGTVVALDERADLAHEVARAGLFDLDDLRAHLSHDPGAERRRDAGTEVEDAHPLERP